MIQRVQSLLLLGVAIISLLLMYIPIYESFPIEPASNVAVDSTGTVNAPPVTMGTPVRISKSAILQILNGSIGVLAFIAILLYKRRNIQIRMSNLAILLTCVFIALLFFMADTMSSDQRIHYLAGSYMPLIQVLLAYLATHFIKKDEELVRSADRLR